MHYASKAVVLGSKAYSDSGKIVYLLVRELGQVPFFIREKRGRKSRVNPYQSLFLLEIEGNYRESKTMQYVKHVEWVAYHRIPFDFMRLPVALFLGEVLQVLLKGGEQDTELFDWIWKSLLDYDRQEKTNPDFHLLFLAQLSKFLGFAPLFLEKEVENIFFSPKEGTFLATHETGCFSKEESLHLMKTFKAKNVFQPLNISSNNRREILSNLLFFYSYRFQSIKRLKSLPVVKALFD